MWAVFHLGGSTLVSSAADLSLSLSLKGELVHFPFVRVELNSGKQQQSWL